MDTSKEKSASADMCLSNSRWVFRYFAGMFSGMLLRYFHVFFWDVFNEINEMFSGMTLECVQVIFQLSTEVFPIILRSPYFHNRNTLAK